MEENLVNNLHIRELTSLIMNFDSVKYMNSSNLHSTENEKFMSDHDIDVSESKQANTVCSECFFSLNFMDRLSCWRVN